jgi:uncharacterized membrane protein
VDLLQGVVQWLHVLGAIFWFGGTLFSNFVVIPAMRAISVPAQQEFGAAVGKTAQIIRPIAYTTIVLGVLRGTLWGPVKSADFLGTAYGITWLVALFVSVGLILYAQLVLEPFRLRIQRATPDQAAAIVRQAGALFGTELLGFFVVFTTMILMRFGL